jgi:hypothetical protein
VLAVASGPTGHPSDEGERLRDRALVLSVVPVTSHRRRSGLASKRRRDAGEVRLHPGLDDAAMQENWLVCEFRMRRNNR